MSTATATLPRRACRPVSTAPVRSRPAIRPIAPRASVFVRRRVVAALIIAVVLVGGGVRAVAAAGAGPASSADRRPAVHVVEPGDTVWSIARQYKPTGDIRSLVRRLTELNGGPDLVVGQDLVLGS